MKKTVHNSKLFNLVRNFANNCQSFLGQYYQPYYLFNTYQELHTRLNQHRSYDEMKAFLSYNGKNMVQKHPLISYDLLDEIMHYLVDIYLEDEYYKRIKTGYDVSEGVKGLEPIFGQSSITIYSIPKCLQSIETLDYAGQDTLKRVVYKENIFNDKKYIKLLDHHTKSPMSYTSAEDLLEYFYTIVEDCVYPNYLFIDENDIREIIFQLSFELSHNTGFFSTRKFTIVKGQSNRKRCFTLINNYSRKSAVIRVHSNDKSISQAYKCIFGSADLSLFEPNFGESQIDLEKALEKHFQQYHLFNNIERKANKRPFMRLNLTPSVRKNQAYQ